MMPGVWDNKTQTQLLLMPAYYEASTHIASYVLVVCSRVHACEPQREKSTKTGCRRALLNFNLLLCTLRSLIYIYIIYTSMREHQLEHKLALQHCCLPGFFVLLSNMYINLYIHRNEKWSCNQFGGNYVFGGIEDPQCVLSQPTQPPSSMRLSWFPQCQSTRGRRRLIFSYILTSTFYYSVNL